MGCYAMVYVEYLIDIEIGSAQSLAKLITKHASQVRTL